MDVNEVLEKKKKMFDVVIFLFFIIFIVVSPIYAMSVDPSYEFLKLPAHILFFGIAAVAILFILLTSIYEKNPEVWISTEEIMHIYTRFILYSFIGIFISMNEIFATAHFVLGHEISLSGIALIYAFYGIVVFIIYFVLKHNNSKAIMEHRYGREIKVNIDLDSTKGIVKKAMKLLKIDYKEVEGNKWEEEPWKLELSDGMKIYVYPDIKKSIVFISKIMEDRVEEERRIEKEIVRLIEEHGQ